MELRIRPVLHDSKSCENFRPVPLLFVIRRLPVCEGGALSAITQCICRDRHCRSVWQFVVLSLSRPAPDLSARLLVPLTSHRIHQLELRESSAVYYFRSAVDYIYSRKEILPKIRRITTTKICSEYCFRALKSYWYQVYVVKGNAGAGSLLQAERTLICCDIHGML